MNHVFLTVSQNDTKKRIQRNLAKLAFEDLVPSEKVHKHFGRNVGGSP